MAKSKAAQTKANNTLLNFWAKTGTKNATSTDDEGSAVDSNMETVDGSDDDNGMNMVFDRCKLKSIDR